jgi:hypothetical protein
MTLPLRMELAMTLKGIFPSGLARLRIGEAERRAKDADSGRNILILCHNASVLRDLEAGC